MCTKWVNLDYDIWLDICDIIRYDVICNLVHYGVNLAEVRNYSRCDRK